MKHPFARKKDPVEIPKKPKNPKKLALVVGILLVCIIGIGVLTEDGGSGHEGEAKIPAAAASFVGTDYEDAVRRFEGSGFTNIQTKRLDDLITGWVTKDGEVERVSIGGDTEFSAGTWVPEDIAVVITYHAFPEGEAPKEEDSSSAPSIQEQLAPYIGKSVSELLPVLAELDCTATFTAENTDMDFTKQLAYDETYGDIFVVTGFRNINETSRTAEVLMLGQETIAQQEKDQQRQSMEERLNEKLDVYIAWDAVKDYGKAQYSSFKLHNLDGKLAEQADDENTWFLKAVCDANGKEGLNCEAQVTGTSDSPQVIYFQVY